MMIPSLGGLAIAELIFFGITYLTRYRVSVEFLLSVFLLMYVLGVAAPRAVDPRPTTLS